MPKRSSRLRLRAPGASQSRQHHAEGSTDKSLPAIKEDAKDLSPTSSLFKELVVAQEMLDAFVCLPILDYDDSTLPSYEDEQAAAQNRQGLRQTRALARRLLAFISLR